MLMMPIYTLSSRMRRKISTERLVAIFATVTNVMGKIAILTSNPPQRKSSWRTLVRNVVEEYRIYKFHRGSCGWEDQKDGQMNKEAYTMLYSILHQFHIFA